MKKLSTAVISLLFFLSLAGMAQRPVPKVYIKTSANRNYQLMVNNKPYVVKGVCYNPISIGQNHEYDWWSDVNKPWLVDGQLMQDMGINTVRVYEPGDNPEAFKKVMQDLYDRFSIRTILGSWLGYWEYPCPFYGDKKFQDKVKAQVLDMVKNYKDEPGLLLWILGNENNYSFGCAINPWSTDEVDQEADPLKQKNMRARIYYSFVNEVAKEIKKIDPDHPVALGNGELISLDIAKEYCPDVDLVATIIYRGKTFGNLFRSLRMTFDKPLLLSEFGADSYDAQLKKEDQNMQAFFLESQWRQIYMNLANNKDGAGNCLGGVMFEWADEWWKHTPADSDTWETHDTESNWSRPEYYFDGQAEHNMNMNEEWFGIVALSPEMENGLNKRSPRKSYYVIREFWKNPILKQKNKKK